MCILEFSGTALHSSVYHLLPVDLRLGPQEALAPSLAESGPESKPVLSNSLPTLLLFECVLAYMTQEASDAIIRWFVNYFSPAPNGVLGSLVYEMFGLGDAFGQIMLNNLKVCFISSLTT
jgi:[phosphatase 2A protein]-leucine-carboxy methyltransferase